MDKLYFLTGPLQGGTAELIGEEITIGRASDNGICLDDDSVFDHHAIINRKGGECVLRDLQSARGTTVRGNKIIVITLEDGDCIAFGLVEAKFSTERIRLHMPKMAASLQSPPLQSPAWHQRTTPSSNPKNSAIRTSLLRLVQLMVVAALAASAYFAYQKLSSVSSSEKAPAAPLVQTASLPKPAAKPAEPPPAVTPAPSAPAVQPPAAPAAAPQPAPAPAPAPTPPPAPVPVVSAPPNPAVQQAMLLIAQGKYQDAITFLDRVIATARDPAIAVQAYEPLKQALNGQIGVIQTARQQWDTQQRAVDDRLKAVQEQLNRNTKALEQKKADEAKVYRTSGGYWFNGKWVYNTRKGTGDSSAQSAIHDLQIKVMGDTQEVKKQTDLLARYKVQITAFDNQITSLQARIGQIETLQTAQPNPGAIPASTPVPSAPTAAAAPAAPAAEPPPSRLQRWTWTS